MTGGEALPTILSTVQSLDERQSRVEAQLGATHYCELMILDFADFEAVTHMFPDLRMHLLIFQRQQEKQYKQALAIKTSKESGSRRGSSGRLHSARELFESVSTRAINAVMGRCVTAKCNRRVTAKCNRHATAM